MIIVYEDAQNARNLDHQMEILQGQRDITGV
jgi:hypothetical protein